MTEALTGSRDDLQVTAAQLTTELKPLLANPSPNSTRLFAEAFKRVQRLPESVSSVELVECLLTIAHYFYLANQPVAALEPATEAALHARQLSDKRSLRKAVTFVGVMRMETGDLPGATEAYSEALQIARELGDAQLVAPVRTNLGGSLIGAAQYSDALK